nr:MAG TPA: hypothetical protein [Caudoviricetes sp.]
MGIQVPRTIRIQVKYAKRRKTQCQQMITLVCAEAPSLRWCCKLSANE